MSDGTTEMADTVPTRVHHMTRVEMRRAYMVCDEFMEPHEQLLI